MAVDTGHNSIGVGAILWNIILVVAIVIVIAVLGYNIAAFNRLRRGQIILPKKASNLYGWNIAILVIVLVIVVLNILAFIGAWGYSRYKSTAAVDAPVVVSKKTVIKAPPAYPPTVYKPVAKPAVRTVTVSDEPIARVRLGEPLEF